MYGCGFKCWSFDLVALSRRLCYHPSTIKALEATLNSELISNCMDEILGLESSGACVTRSLLCHTAWLIYF
jgi:hypothetical protein